ncbi:MAG: DUF1572 domain-containing protein [Bacteroidetes bacterium]|nr:DUF1572 domain-containing protein [Bacteroidota bacterium]
MSSETTPSGSEIINGLIQLFRYYKTLGDKAMQQTPDENLFVIHDKESNSVAVIVKHMWGNMLSRWTNFLTSDGEKEWRQRDAEFENDISDSKDLWGKWEEGWQCLFNALEPLTDADLNKIVYIRNQGHTVLEALHRQLGHYAYHVGQIVFLCKSMSDNWQSLSIPKGGSASFNKEKFDQEKHRQHFSSEFTNDKE